jgi:uncharacterized membrane protein YebE (DUF533 family)
MNTANRIAAFAVLAGCACAALAQTPVTPAVDRREARQEKRIEQGEKSGALTPKEAAKLERGQTHVENMEAKAKADGKVTAKERARLERAQNVQSRKIYREKHDRQRDLNHDGKQDRPHPRRAAKP